jgi:hypothetical protein
MTRFRTFLAVTALLVPASAGAQGVVVDQGTFAVRIGGADAGTEEFVIRRAGLGSGDALFASGVVSLTAPVTRQIRPLLRAQPLSGAAEEYQVSVTGADAAEIRMGLAGRRYVASIRSATGAEDREFQGRPDTRVLESEVAHHYYFVRDDRPGREVFVLEPRSRRPLTLSVDAAEDEELRMGPNVVNARRVTLTTGDGQVRRVWFDRQGRVLRVEIPDLGYVAERTDLVG